MEHFGRWNLGLESESKSLRSCPMIFQIFTSRQISPFINSLLTWCQSAPAPGREPVVQSRSDQSLPSGSVNSSIILLLPYLGL